MIRNDEILAEVPFPYFRIGIKYWKLIEYVSYDKRRQLELHPWTREAIVDDYGKDSLKDVRKFSYISKIAESSRQPDTFYFDDFEKTKYYINGTTRYQWIYVLVEAGRFLANLQRNL